MNNEYSNTSALHISCGKGLLALSPILVFLLTYVVVSVIIGDFYKMPLSIAFIIASMWALLITPKLKVTERIDIFSKGAANTNILYMIWIFILAGAFSSLANGLGAIDATVNLTLSVLPPPFLIPGLFIAACFISMSIGTSVGTTVALTPFAYQLAQSTGANTAFLVSVVLGGSFFGDNLSFISDTTIAATRSLKVKMNDKFKTNLSIALPAALLVLVVYILFAHQASALHPISSVAVAKWWLVIPYLIVIASAVAGINVLIVLTSGILSCIIIGLISHSPQGLIDMCSLMGNGVKDMSELIIVTLLAAGLLETINHNGGITFIIQWLTKNIHSSRGAQAIVAVLVSFVNICTANNTIAIITVGKIASHITAQFGLDPRKVASILDTCSCITQSILPYGAQVLLAAGLSKLSPISFLPYLYYTWALALMVVLSIVFNFPHSKATAATKS